MGLGEYVLIQTVYITAAPSAELVLDLYCRCHRVCRYKVFNHGLAGISKGLWPTSRAILGVQYMLLLIEMQRYFGN